MKYNLSLNGEQIAGVHGSLSDAVTDGCTTLIERDLEIGCYRDCDLIAISAELQSGPQIRVILLFESFADETLIYKRWDVFTGVTARCEYHRNNGSRLAAMQPDDSGRRYPAYAKSVTN